MVYWIQFAGPGRLGTCPRPRGGDWLEYGGNMYRLIALIFLTIVSVSCCGQGAGSVQRLPGDQWLGMATSMREQWTAQFIAGYDFAAHQICDFVESDFEPDSALLRAEVKRTQKTPSQICLEKTYRFTHLGRPQGGGEYDFYDSTITSFYVKNPGLRDIPPVMLLIRLSDGREKSSAELLLDVQKGIIKK